MELAMNMGAFEALDNSELFAVDGGVNWDRVFGGSVAYLAATAGLCALSGPIGWGVAACYLATCAASGAYIGYGLCT